MRAVNKEADQDFLNEDAAPRPSTLTGNVTPVISIPKPINMIITVGKRKFECVPMESASDATEKSKKEKLNEIFQIPQAEGKDGTCMHPWAAKTSPLHIS